MKRVFSRVFTFHPGLRFKSPEDHIANSLYFESKTFLHGLFLVGDRLSMANGLEERFPFMDNDLVAFACKIPPKLKLRELDNWKRQDENILGKKKAYFAQHDDGKNILREALTELLPNKVLSRPKQGFSSPDESWYRGPNLKYVQDLVMSRQSLCHEYINRKAIDETINRHCNGGENLRLRIWSLVCFELWLRIFMDNGHKGFAHYPGQPPF